MSDPKRDRARRIVEYLWQAQNAMERLQTTCGDEYPALREEAKTLADAFTKRGEALRAMINDDDLPTAEDVQKIYQDCGNAEGRPMRPGETLR